MKPDTHPTYHTDAKITCACGNTITTGSTKKSIKVEICSNCHPFYTGKGKLVDTAGRVERFEERLKKAKAMKKKKPSKSSQKKSEAQDESSDE